MSGHFRITLTRHTMAMLVLVGLAVVALLPSPARAEPHSMRRGFADDVWFTGGPKWLHRTEATGAQVVLLEVDWYSIEPHPPATKNDASNPAAPQFNFGYLDNVVRQFRGTGISVAMYLLYAPRWAEAKGGPAHAEAIGAWKPNAQAFGQAARALAGRYSGSYPDPLHPGHKLPRVRYFQAWSEENLSTHIQPQWRKQGKAYVPAAPAHYRQMLNDFYTGVKSVHHDNVVIIGGLAPYGGLRPGTPRMPPALFARSLMCLNGEALKPAPCPDPAHFDVIASDPYEIGSPTQRAYNRDDVTAPDLWKLTRVVRKAVHSGRALPRRHKGLWVSEFSYDSNPPNPYAVSTYTQARWLEEVFYVFWRQGVSTAIWYLIRDSGGKRYVIDYFSGVYFHHGRRKPSFTAFRFPFVVMGSTAWGISPEAGTVLVQRRSGHSWKTLFRKRVKADGVFTHSVPTSLHGSFRATVDGESSLVWKR
jgi:hypothetical protein